MAGEDELVPQVHERGPVDVAADVDGLALAQDDFVGSGVLPAVGEVDLPAGCGPVQVQRRHHPLVVERREPGLVVWSRLWPNRPDAVIRFELPADDAGHGTDLTWSLLLGEPEPDASLLGHIRKRINVLINGDLRFSFGQ